MEELSSRVSVKEDQSGLFIATVTMEEPKLSTEIANHIAEFIQNYVSEETKHKATQYREFIEERMSIAKIDLTFSEDNLTIFRKNHPLQLDTPELTAERARFMRTIEVNQQVYVTLRQQFEIARLEELRDKPVIEILDKAIEPVKNRRQKSFDSLRNFYFIIFTGDVFCFDYAKKKRDLVIATPIDLKSSVIFQRDLFLNEKLLFILLVIAAPIKKLHQLVMKYFWN